MNHHHDDGTLERLAVRCRRSAAELRPAGSIRDGEPGGLLVTGASGFFGRSLVRELATAMPGRKIHCLVRGASSRISGAGAAGRIHLVVGDLSLPRLGLSAQEWRELAREVAVIVHAGALVNHFLPLERLVGANVSGTLTILGLAGECRPKRVHFVSSASAARHDSAANGVPAHPPRGGYAQSKWLAECVTEICRTSGFEVSTYRLGALGPDSETGEVNVNDSRWFTIKAALESGYRPLCRGGPRWLPVDVAARMVAGVVARGPDPAARHHLRAPTGPTWDAVFDEATRLGHDLDTVDRETWFDRVRTRARAGDATSMKVLALGLPRQPGPGHTPPGSDLVAVGGVTATSWQPNVLSRTLQWATGHGFFHPRET